jgi:hypothetical protein
MPDEIEAFARRKEVQRDRDELDNLVEAARSCGPQKGFQLGESELNRIEVRAVGWEETEARTDPCNCRLHRRLLVHREVIQDDDVAGAERRGEHLLDIGEKRGIIDRSVEDGGRR